MASLQTNSNNSLSPDDTKYSDNVTPLYSDKGHQRVVIIDDQKTGRTIMEALIKKISSYIRIYTFSDPGEALEACEKHPPDLLITDYRMPLMDGIEVIKKFRSLNDCKIIPVVMVTIVQDREVMYTALEAGATDFLSRPFDHYECQARCKNLLNLYKYQKASFNRAKILEYRVTQATEEIKSRETEALICLARAGEFRDEGTGNHIFRMAKYSLEIARELGLDKDSCDRIWRASPMHDIGKIGIPDSILKKKSELSNKEFDIIKSHTTIGGQILEGSECSMLQMAHGIALGHHEWWNGDGYPAGLSGEAIPAAARIVALADVYDALSNDRIYADALPADKVIEYMEKRRITQFDPYFYDIFVDLIPEFVKLSAENI
ncbi:MAG: response regulator [Thiotrichaceae bacterium]|nr:response regulator [Thiotrichaceae bacterium]